MAIDFIAEDEGIDFQEEAQAPSQESLGITRSGMERYAQQFDAGFREPYGGPEVGETAMQRLGKVILGPEIPRVESPSNDLIPSAAAAAFNLVGGAANFVRSPLGGLAAGSAAIPGGPMALSALFGADMAKTGGEQLGTASVTGDRQLGLEGAGALTMAALPAAHVGTGAMNRFVPERALAGAMDASPLMLDRPGLSLVDRAAIENSRLPDRPPAALPAPTAAETSALIDQAIKERQTGLVVPGELPAIEKLKRQFEDQIIPGEEIRRVENRPEGAQGGQISFAADADAGAIPSARQAAQRALPDAFRQFAAEEAAAGRPIELREGEYRYQPLSAMSGRLNQAQRRAALEAGLTAEQPPIQDISKSQPEVRVSTSGQPLSKLQRERLSNAINRGASPETIHNILRTTKGGDVFLNVDEVGNVTKPSNVETKGVPNALQPETTQPVRDVREKPIEGAREVPTEVAGSKADVGRGKVQATPEMTLAADIAKADGPTFTSLITDSRGRPDVTGAAYRVGDSVTFLEQLNQLLEGRKMAQQQLGESRASGNLDMALSTKGQFFREAVERATKSGSAEAGMGSATLDYRTNPKVAEWLVKNGKEIGLSEDAIAPIRESLAKPEPPNLITRLESLKFKGVGGGVGANPFPEIGKAVWNTGIDVAIASVKAGRKIGEAVDAAISHLKKNARGFDEAKVRSYLSDLLTKEGESVPITAKAAVGAPVSTATKPNLNAVYKIFEPAPRQRRSVGQVLKDTRESIRTGLSSKFRPLDKLADDISAAYGSTVKRIAGTFEALKGSTGRSEAEVYRFDNDVSRAVKGKEKDFNAYMFLRRSLDRLNMDLADIQKAQAGTEVKTLNRRAVAGYTIPQLESNLAALEAKLGPEVKATFEKAADQYQQHMDKALRWQVESGRMSAEVYDSIKAGNQFYAPFKVLKYLEESNRPAGTGKRIDTPAEYTKAMEGIEDPNFKLGDMLAAGRMGLRVSRILSDKHAAMRTMADLAPFDVEGKFIQRLKEGTEAPAGSEAVNVFESGKQVRYAVPKEVAEAVQLFDTQGTGLVETIFRGGAVPFRAGATAWNIPFQVSNLMADIPRSVLVARTGFRGNPVDLVRLPFDYVHSVYASLMGDVVSPITGLKPPKLFLDFLDSGAAGTTMQEAFTPGALRFHQSSRLAQGTKLGKTVLRTIPQIATAIEQSTKIFGVMRAMRMSGQESGAALYKNGKDLLTEVRRFSGSPDFGRIGKWTDAYRLNVMVPFLNARIQGTVADLGRLSGRDGAKTAAATWTKLGLAIGVPTAALYALNNSDEYAEDYAKIPEKEKQNYWHFPKDSFVTLDNGEKIRDYWRIPKRESGKWVANLTESSLDFARHTNPEQAGRWLKSLIEDVSPVNVQGNSLQERGESVVAGLNPLLKAPLEVVTGRDLYRHRDVVPQSMQKASPENQFTDRTPEAFKRLAEAMPDVAPEVLRSPIMLENMTRNLTAGLFTQFLPGRPVEGRSELENNPMLKRFQAALYTDEREVRQEIEALQRESADTYLDRHRGAEKILKDNKSAPLKDILVSAARSPGADVRLLQHTVDLYVAEKAGITGPERQLLALPITQRAQFIARRLEGASAETRKEIILNFARKRILTEGVAEELARQMTPQK